MKNIKTNKKLSLGKLTLKHLEVKGGNLNPSILITKICTIVIGLSKLPNYPCPEPSQPKTYPLCPSPTNTCVPV